VNHYAAESIDGKAIKTALRTNSRAMKNVFTFGTIGFAGEPHFLELPVKSMSHGKKF
jgi:hypothetical protein